MPSGRVGYTEVIRSNGVRGDHRATDTCSDHTSPNGDLNEAALAADATREVSEQWLLG